MDAQNEVSVTVNGEVCTPLTHSFKDGQPVLNKDGTPRKKMGRKFGSKNLPKSITAPTEAPAANMAVGGDKEVAEALATLEEADKVPLSVGKQDAVPATQEEVNASAAMGIAQTHATPQPVEAPKVQHILKEVTATVARTYGKIGAPETKDETIEVKTFVTQPATVEIGYGLTLNIGNYESARVDVKVSVPCYREETDAAYEYAKTWAESRVKQEVAAVRKMAVPQKSNPF